MPTLDEHNLLPVGKTIPLGERWLRIVKRVGEGYTSVVYEGTVLLHAEDATDQGEKVAVKAFKPYMDRDSFRQEDRTLWDLTRLEPEEAKDLELDKGPAPRLGIELHVSPRYFGSANFNPGAGAEKETPFIVMEYITGKEIPDLIERDGKLSEKDALSTMRDFFFILDVLHSRLKKTLMDMKFENLWWQETDGRGRVRVMDLGTLSDLKPTARYFGNSRLDLMRAGIMFFRMLTGYGLAYSVEGLKEAVEPLLKQYPMSWGTRRIVRKLLHWKEDQRFTEAIEVYGELNNMVSYWSHTDADLLTNALEKIGQALQYRQEIQKSGDEEESEEPPFAYQARSMLGVIEARNPRIDEATQRAIHQVEDLLSIEDYLRTGRKFLEGGSYPKAVEHFKNGMYYSDEPAVLRRWYYAASAATELRTDVYAPVSPNLNRALERLNHAQYTEALLELKLLPENVRACSWIQALATDCDLYTAFEVAQKAEKTGQYQAAAAAYEKAQTLLERLPNPDDVTVQELGDLKVRMVDLKHLEITRGEAEKLLPQAAEKVGLHDYAAALNIFSEVREKDPRNPGLQPQLAAAIDAATLESRFVEAEQLIRFALQRPGYDNALLERKAVAQGLAKADWQVKLIEPELFSRQASLLLQAYPGNEIILTVLRGLIEKLEKTLTGAKLPAQLAMLLPVVEALPGDNQVWQDRIQAAAKNMKEAAGASSKNAVDELIAKATRLTAISDDGNAAALSKNMRLQDVLALLDQPAQACAQAVTFLKEAGRIAAPVAYRLEEIQTLLDQALKRIARLEEQQKDAGVADQAKKQELLDGVNAAWKEAQDAMQFQTPVWFSPEARAMGESSSLQLVKIALIRAHGYLQRFSDPDETVKKILDQASEILDHEGETNWQALGEYAAQRIQTIRGEFDAVNRLFVQGDYQQAAADVDRLAKAYGSSQELDELKANITKVHAFEVWQRENAAALLAGNYEASLLEKIENLLKDNLPAVYWKNSPTSHYLQEAVKNIKADTAFSKPKGRRVPVLTGEMGRVNRLLKQLPK